MAFGVNREGWMDERTRAEVGAPLEARRAALLAADAEGLARLLHPEFRYVDSLGRSLDRATYLASRATGEVEVLRQEVVEIGLSGLSPGVVLATGRVRDVGRYRGGSFESAYRVAHVCVRATGGWVFIYGQSTTIEEKSSA